MRASKSFDTLFATGKPRCGQVRDSQRELLFGSEANDIGSVALVPLGDHGSLGLLALGSTDRDRFHPGMSTEFPGAHGRADHGCAGRALTASMHRAGGLTPAPA